MGNTGYPSSLKSISRGLVAATTDLYAAIATSLRPTPLKSHYTFNLRDLSKVFQGVCSQCVPVVPCANVIASILPS